MGTLADREVKLPNEAVRATPPTPGLSEPIQYRLRVGAASDPAEAEADRMAEEVLRRAKGAGVSLPGTEATSGSSRIRRAVPPLTNPVTDPPTT
jgi:hypothetical protein